MRQVMVPVVVSLGLLAAACGGTEQPQAPGARGTKPAPVGDEKAGEKTVVAGSPRRYALLVGCTRYDHLPASKHLRGPANDVKLMREVLTKKFRFADKDIVTLAEGSGAANRPIRANIKREFDRLAGIAGKGDEIVILLSGHGSQQPDQEPFDEPDGLDETFLPADAGPWNDAKEMVANAIVDDELDVWTKAIVDRGAFLWVILDSCHSGTMLRDVEGEVAREIAPEDLVPKAALEKARKAATERKRSGVVPQVKPFEGTAPHPRLVGIYAAQSHEPTVERAPYDGSTTEPYGLLTYTLCQLLTQAKTPLTYRELVQRIHNFYLQQGRIGPTPLIDGPEQDREVLGMQIWPGRSRFTLRKEEDVWKITGGGLHGLTEGSILAVYPPAGERKVDAPVGYVRIHKGHPVEAEVEPCTFKGLPAPKDLPAGGRVELASLDFGALRLKVAVDLGGESKEGSALRQLEQELRKRAKDPTALFQVADKGQAADWLLQKRDDQLLLIPTGFAGRQRGLPTDFPKFGPYAADKLDKLQDELTRIARAANLLKLTKSVGEVAGDEATRAGADSASAVELEVVMLKFKNSQDREGQPIKWEGGGITLKPGDRVKWLFKNHGRVPVDVSLLFISNQFGIRALYPRPGKGDDNRLAPGKSLYYGPVTITGTTTGLEHVVVIAVRGDGATVDFGCLAQPSLKRAENVVVVNRGDPKKTFGSALGKLFHNGLYAQGVAREVGAEEVTSYALRLLSWRVVPQPKVVEKK